METFLPYIPSILIGLAVLVVALKVPREKIADAPKVARDMLAGVGTLGTVAFFVYVLPVLMGGAK